MIKKSWLMLLVMMLLITVNAWAQEAKSGSWLFELKTDHTIIPFIAELNFDPKKLSGKIINGKETIPIEKMMVKGKTISIPLQTYENTLELTIESPTSLKGYWVRHNKNPKVEIPIVGVFGPTNRFPGKNDPPKINLDGKWAIQIAIDHTHKSQGVAIFEQKGNVLTGTILSPTGDYRYLEGFVSDDEFAAASFDGVMNYLVKGTVKQNEMRAVMLSTTVTKITGHKDPKAVLPDAYTATQMEAPLEFSFPDLKGKKITLTDKQFKNKPVVVQFFGSWCPNCLDEMNYLIPWYNKNKKRGIEIIALAFERSLSEAEAKVQLLKVQKKAKITYPLLLAGATSEDKPMDKIKGLKNFISFPTTIFLNKKHEVVKIHAGFSGPSTGEFYEDWKTEFNKNVDGLLK
ncbi:MAG TPA: TlpA disulfide reductase family protein [Bacteriovoracaceae bacterium]|nr:TlpA disulfide reductase family protein [Bacteriovoracaceae bacterium]